MWKYEKKLEYPINIKNKDLGMAKILMAQYGGPDGELGAAIRYLNQRYTMPDERGYALLSDIGTEELGHAEMIATMVTQLLKNTTIEELKENNLSAQYTQHDHSVYPQDGNGIPFNVAGIGSLGDWKADLFDDMAAEQKARATYEHLMNMTNDPDLLAPLSFLRQREVIHFQRFKELYEYYMNKYKKD